MQFGDLHNEWTNNFKVMLTVTYGNRVVYVHREKNIYIFNLLDYIEGILIGRGFTPGAPVSP